MFVLNKKTGLKWYVDGELLERLKQDSDYQLIEETKEKPKTPKKPTEKEVGE